MATPFERVTLEGNNVVLKPLSDHHADSLATIIQESELWKLFVTSVPPATEIRQYIDQAHATYHAGEGLAFVIINKDTDQIVGSSRFTRAEMKHKRLEIGYTFLGNQWQRTKINTEAKLLMLSYAFEQLAINRVEFITDYLNHRSQQALIRIGAKKEGIMRNHMIMRDGRIRDSILFSIIKQEWPGIKQHLLFKLESN